MNTTQPIRRISSLLLLLVFALSITPKQFLHDAVATHHHYSEKHRGEVHVENKTFICSCDSLVTESPFIDSVTSNELKPLIFLSGEYKQFISSLHFTTEIDFQLRGPPAIV